MAQGLWKCVKPDRAIPSVGYKTKEEEVTDTKGKARAVKVTRTTNQDEVNAWYEAAEKVLGSIRLRLVDNIGIQHSEINDPANLWKALLEAHGNPGMSHAFSKFKGAMDTMIPNGSDPGPALNKILAHFTQLDRQKWKIPDNVKGLMILSKAPASMEATVQIICLATSANKGQLKDLTPEKVAKTLRETWENHGREGSCKNQQQTNKLSAVKPAGSQPPNFQQQQQQQQRGEGGQNRGG
jgi:hypothetical protein